MHKLNDPHYILASLLLREKHPIPTARASSVIYVYLGNMAHTLYF